MDRRRFIPRLDGLEARQLLSTATPATTAQVSTATTVATTDPNIDSQRETRIERLPQLLQQIRRDRFIPPGLIEALQNDLRAIENKLTAPPSASLRAFNLQLRKTISKSSISVADAKVLSNYFQNVLTRSNLDPKLVSRFGQHMEELARNSVNARSSASLVASDYSLLLQLSMGIGIKTPEARTPTPRGPRATTS